MNKGRDTLMKVLAILALVYIITRTDLLKFIGLGKSGYELKELEDVEQEPANNNVIPRCEMKAGTGLASSLLPREVASQEDFGQFAPEEVLKGQNFMDPREQIGFPETIGGTLRNSNQSIRAEPANPKNVYTWNNSTIVPDLMQRKLFT
jgi:hypothetical protein